MGASTQSMECAIPVYSVCQNSANKFNRVSEDLLSLARMQWQFGDWDSLKKIKLLLIEPFPDRAELALLAGCAYLQAGEFMQGKLFLETADGWGCDQRFMLRLLTAGIYNSLGRYSTMQDREQVSLSFFNIAATGLGGDPVLAGEARRNREKNTLSAITAQMPEKVSRFERAATVQKNPTNDEVSREIAIEGTSMADNPFKAGITSYAQNLEDVMLWRSLGDVKNGFYIDIGAQDPIFDSVSKAFYERGWRGIHVEATHFYSELLKKDRPDEIVIESAVSNHHGDILFFEIPQTGISTGDPDIANSHKERGFQGKEIRIPLITLMDIFALSGDNAIHWMKIDVEGMEENVLRGWGDAPQRPWIVVVESTLPLTNVQSYETWECFLLRLDYRFIYFDGLSRFYISNKHPEFEEKFKTGPNVFDQYTRR